MIKLVRLFNFLSILIILHLCTFKTPSHWEDAKNHKKCKVNSKNYTYDGPTLSIESAMVRTL